MCPAGGGTYRRSCSPDRQRRQHAADRAADVAEQVRAVVVPTRLAVLSAGDTERFGDLIEQYRVDKQARRACFRAISRGERPRSAHGLRRTGRGRASPYELRARPAAPRAAPSAGDDLAVLHVVVVRRRAADGRRDHEAHRHRLRVRTRRGELADRLVARQRIPEPAVPVAHHRPVLVPPPAVLVGVRRQDH